MSFEGTTCTKKLGCYHWTSSTLPAGMLHWSAPTPYTYVSFLPLLDWSRTCFTSLFGAVILDESITCESVPSAFGSVELLSWKYLRKDMTVILTSSNTLAWRPTPKISQGKLLQIYPKPRNPLTFFTLKVFRYTVAASSHETSKQLLIHGSWSYSNHDCTQPNYNHTTLMYLWEHITFIPSMVIYRLEEVWC